MTRTAKAEQKREPVARPHGRKVETITLVLLATLAVAGGLVFWLKQSQSASVLQGSGTNAINPPVAGVAAPGGLQKLVGRWVRPDGGYVIQIKSVQDNGTLEAAYLNPNPIHVAQAKASLDGSTVKVFVELRDVNYPGSTYTLQYEPAADLLKGIYYQAVAQEQYQIFFQRLKD